MGTINVVLRVDRAPEMAYVPDPDEPMLEFHFVLDDGGTLDLLMTPEIATATLAAGGVMRATMEQERAHDAAR